MLFAEPWKMTRRNFRPFPFQKSISIHHYFWHILLKLSSLGHIWSQIINRWIFRLFSCVLCFFFLSFSVLVHHETIPNVRSQTASPSPPSAIIWRGSLEVANEVQQLRWSFVNGVHFIFLFLSWSVVEPLVFVKLIYLSLVVSFILKLKKHKNKKEVGVFFANCRGFCFFIFFILAVSHVF